jgi:hypothetical protein
MPRQVPVTQSQNSSSNKSNNNHIPTTPLFPSCSPQPSWSHFSFTSSLLDAIEREEREEEEQNYHDALPTPLSPIQELGQNTKGMTTQWETSHQVRQALVEISGQQIAPTSRYNIPIGTPLNHVGAVIHQFNRQGAHQGHSEGVPRSTPRPSKEQVDNDRVNTHYNHVSNGPNHPPLLAASLRTTRANARARGTKKYPPYSS